MGRSLQEWRKEWEDDTGTISHLVRNFAFAGIGIIWIFKNTDINHHILPLEFVGPLTLIIAGLFLDLLQYMWRALNTWVVYKFKERQVNSGALSKEKSENIPMPNYISRVCWIIWAVKVLLITSAYVKLFFILFPKISE